jgi:hypothetical protein
VFVIEGVPVVCCKMCGEHYLTARTLTRLDLIQTNRSRWVVSRRVPVVKFGESA